MSAAAGRPQLPLAQKAPWWLLGTFIVTSIIGLAYAVAWTFAEINGSSATRPVESTIINGVDWLASVAVAGLQATALAGLYTRRHWGRAVATIAAGFWVFTVIGVLFAALAWWALHRRWDPGVEATFTREHPAAPAYVVGLCAVGTALLLAWVWFLYFYIVPLLVELTRDSNPPIDPSSWYGVISVVLFFSLPFWVVQALALIGLRQKHDWGAVLATITCILWVLSLVGLPFGVAGLFVLWRWQHPALGPHVPVRAAA